MNQSIGTVAGLPAGLLDIYIYIYIYIRHRASGTLSVSNLRFWASELWASGSGLWASGFLGLLWLLGVLGHFWPPGNGSRVPNWSPEASQSNVHMARCIVYYTCTAHMVGKLLRARALGTPQPLAHFVAGGHAH